MPRRQKLSLTLLELIIVVVIVGVIVTFAMPAYIGARRRTIDREARSQLNLIQTAQEVYRLEVGGYVNCADNLTCNQNLRLDLPAGTATGGNWNYSVSVPVAPGDNTFDASGVGTSGTGNWQIDEDDNCAHDGSGFPPNCSQ